MKRITGPRSWSDFDGDDSILFGKILGEESATLIKAKKPTGSIVKTS